MFSYAKANGRPQHYVTLLRIIALCRQVSIDRWVNCLNGKCDANRFNNMFLKKATIFEAFANFSVLFCLRPRLRLSYTRYFVFCRYEPDCYLAGERAIHHLNGVCFFLCFCAVLPVLPGWVGIRLGLGF